MIIEQIAELEKILSNPYLPSDILSSVEQSREALMQKKKMLEQFSINQHQDGRWCCYYKRSDGTYKKIFKRTRDAVIDELEKLVDEAPAITIASLYPDYLKTLKRTGHSRTACCYNSDWLNYLAESSLVSRDIEALTPRVVLNDLLAISKKHTLTQRKFRDVKTVVNRVLDMAVMDGVIPSNPARAIHGISADVFAAPPDEGEQVYTDEQEIEIIKTCLDYYKNGKRPGYLAVILNFRLGLRVGELSALKPSDFDFDHYELTVQRSERRQHDDNLRAEGVVVRKGLKAHKSHRTVSIDDDTVALVKLISEACGSSEWLFVQPNGERMTASCVQHALQRVCEKTGISITGNHKIRKTVISRMIQSGLFSDTDIKERAGHEDYATTQKYYARTFRDKRDDTAKRLSAALNPGISTISIFSEKVETSSNP